MDIKPVTDMTSSEQLGMLFATECDCGAIVQARSGHKTGDEVEFMYHCPHCGMRWWDTYEFNERERV